MYDVRLVLKQVVNALDDISFAEHNFIPHGHEPVLHVGLESVYEVYAPVEERFEEFFLDISPVGKDLPVKFLGEYLPYPFVPVVHVCPCQAEGYDVSGIVAQQMLPPDIVAHGNHGAVHKRDAGTFAEGVQLHEKHHQKEHPRHQFDKAVV